MAVEGIEYMADLEEDKVVGTDGIKDSETEERSRVIENSVVNEEGMAPPTAGNSIHRSTSRPQLDVSKAEIQGNVEEKDPIILLPNQSDDISHLALDIGGMVKVDVSESRHFFSKQWENKEKDSVFSL